MEKRREKHDVVVIGAGAAGLTAAIYLGRARLDTLVIEEALPGGLATYTSEIENYPGFPETISGPDLMKLFEKQAKKFGVKIKLAKVDSVDFSGDPKIVRTMRVDYEAKAVVVATGGKPRLTGAKNEDKFLFGKGLSFCATCDAARYTGKTILVVGSGDAAVEEALFLAKFCDKIYISVIHDEGIMDANKVAQERAWACPKFEFVWNTVVDEYLGDDLLEAVVLRNVKTGEKIKLDVDAVFLFIGYVPNTEVFKGVLDMSRNGYIKTDDIMRTSVDGVFAVGDVRDKYLRQVATSVGDGAVAGVAVERYIAEMEYLHSEILQAEKPGLVYCWNAVDAASRDFLRVIEDISARYDGRLKVSKIDMYKGAGLGARVGVCESPAVVLVSGGEVVERVVGADAVYDENALRSRVQRLVSASTKAEKEEAEKAAVQGIQSA